MEEPGRSKSIADEPKFMLPLSDFDNAAAQPSKTELSSVRGEEELLGGGDDICWKSEEEDEEGEIESAAVVALEFDAVVEVEAGEAGVDVAEDDELSAVGFVEDFELDVPVVDFVDEDALLEFGVDVAAVACGAVEVETFELASFVVDGAVEAG